MPTSNPIIMATSATSRVAGRRSRIKSNTGRLCTKDVPKSPRRMLLRNVMYCSGSGLSRPSSIARSILSCSVKSSSASISTGSPTTYMPKKTMSDMINASNPLWPKRFAIKLIMRFATHRKQKSDWQSFQSSRCWT